MSLASGVNNPAIDNLVQSSLESENKDLRLKWIPYSEIANMEPTQSDNVHHAMRKYRLYGKVDETTIMLLLLGSSEECTPTFVSEFARKYSLPTHKDSNDAFCFNCKAPRPLDWTTGNKPLDLFIMES